MSKLSALSSLAGPVNRNSGLIPAYLTVTPSVTSMYEGEGSVVFTVKTFAIPNNTVAYYTINQISGTIGTASFVSASLSGSFTVNNNTGSFTIAAAAEDGNSTDDIFTVNIRESSITGAVLLTSPQIKIVDLTVYNSAVLTYNNGFGGMTMTYAIAATSSGAGNKTTVTFNGVTITANGGAAGQSPGTYAAGGTYSGGDGGYAGGTGQFGSTWRGVGGYQGGSGPAGGGGAPGGNNGGSPGQYAGGWVGTTLQSTTNTRLNGLLGFISNMGWTYNMSGPATSPTTLGYSATGSPGNYFGGGGGGYSMTQNLTAGNTNYARAYGGAGGMGGGGGGAGAGTSVNYLGVYTYSSQAGGVGGPGGVIIQYDNTTSGAFITTGTSRTIPTGVKTIKVWAIGGGGGGKSSTVTLTTGVYGGDNGGGGGGGGTVWKTWTYTGSAPVKPSL